MAIDYRALIRDRQEKQTRPLVRHEVCLDPALYGELEDAQEALLDATAAAYDDEGKLKDPRGGGSGITPDIHEAQQAVEAVEQRIADASLTMVLKAPTAERQAAYHDEIRSSEVSERDRTIIESTRPLILDCFQYAEGAGRERLDLTRDDLAPLIAEWTHGEVVRLGNKLQDASVGGA